MIKAAIDSFASAPFRLRRTGDHAGMEAKAFSLLTYQRISHREREANGGGRYACVGDQQPPRPYDRNRC